MRPGHEHRDRPSAGLLHLHAFMRPGAPGSTLSSLFRQAVVAGLQCGPDAKRRDHGATPFLTSRIVITFNPKSILAAGRLSGRHVRRRAMRYYGVKLSHLLAGQAGKV